MRIPNRMSFILAPLVAGGLAFSCSEPVPTPEVTEEAPPTQELEARIQDLEAELAEKEGTLAELRSEIERLQDLRPQSHSVEPGETHWQIAERYLVEEEGLEPEAAKRELQSSVLLEPILEGHDVWNYYDGEIFGSFVTQANAAVSPGELAREQRREAEQTKEDRRRLRVRVAELRGQLQTQEARLNDSIDRLERRLETKTGEVDSLRSYIDSTLEQQEALRSKVVDLTERLSSVYYLAGTKDALRADGKVRDTLFTRLGIGEVDSEDIEKSVDLRETSNVRLTADELGVPSIGSVDVLPRHWERGTDYRVDISSGGEIATIELIDADQFRLRTLLIVVES